MPRMKPPPNTELPGSLTIGLPLFLIFGLLILDLAMPGGRFRELWIDSERGLVENLTTLFALVGLCTALIGARRSSRAGLPWLTAWLALFAFGFFYMAVEEASWGQHWIGWETPEWLARHNLYGETNFHNFSYRIDRVPKSLVGACIVVMGLGWPLFRSRLEPGMPAALRPLHWILPTRTGMPMAAGIFVIWLLNRTLVVLDLDRGNSVGFAGQEHLELLMSCYLLLYTLTITRRLRPAAAVPA